MHLKLLLRPPPPPGEHTLPQVIDGLGDEEVNPLVVPVLDQVSHPIQLPLQVLDAGITHAWHYARLQDHVDLVPDVVEVAAELAHDVVP